MYTYDFPRPGLTADCVIFGFGAADAPLQVLLIERAKYPFEGSWAVPGGFVEEGEEPLQAAQREIAEETGLPGLPMHQFYTFGRPGRDPRGWVVTVAHWTVVQVDQVQPQAGDDAARADWFPLNDLPKLAFDHDEMIERAANALEKTLILAENKGVFPPHSVAAEELRAAIDHTI